MRNHVYMNRIPDSAKQVFEGKIFEVWQWEQAMYDGSTATFERLRRPDTAQVIAVVGDNILVQAQEQPDKLGSFRSLPGGRCDEGEDALTAAKRELLEETGYASDDWTLWMENQPVGKIDWTVHTFIAHNCRLVQAPQLDAGEKITNTLMTFDQFLLFVNDPAFRSEDVTLAVLRARLDYQLMNALRGLFFKNVL